MVVPAGFPTDGLRFCFEALQQTNGDGTTVGTLTDQSVNAHHITQGTTASQGIFRTSAIGGKAAVEFDGVDDYYIFPTAALGMFQNVGGGTMIAVIADKGVLTSTTSRRIFFSSRGTSSGAVRAIISHAENGGATMKPNLVVRRLDADTATGIEVGAVTADSVVRSGMVDWSAGDGFLYENGELIGSNLTLTSSGLTENTASVVINLGAAGRAADSNLGLFWKGHIALAATWNRTLTDAERTNVAKYLQDTYGIEQTNYPAPLSTPTGLAGVLVSSTQINLSWNAVTNATGYDVERNGKIVAINVSTTSYPDTGLVAGTSYKYRVRARG